MIRIKKVKISNYRSINNLTFDFDLDNNFVSFCGANNVGKTNVLNALALFFGKLKYIPGKDSPNHKFYGTRGGHWQPKVEITFSDDKDIFIIKKDWNLTNEKKDKIKQDFKIAGEKNKTRLDEKKIKDFLEKINFFYLESINVSFPEVIKYIMNSDVIDIETGNLRLSGRKKQMKELIEKVLDELKIILDELGNNITPLLGKYKDGWSVAFDFPKRVDTFRDLMIGEIDFYIRDKSDSKFIDAKGAGLQRLSHVLMHFRILEKLNENKKNAILIIDEPDVYLHSALQKQLLSDIKTFSEKNQIFVTTHSPMFIDTVKLSNVFLLDQEIENKTYKRTVRKSGEKEFNIIKTQKVDLNKGNGISKLKKYLGIENKDYLLFDQYNILVEGEEDKIYLSKLLENFNLDIPNIIPVHGADNIIKHLEFYDSITDKDISFLVLLDNDNKGRTIFDKIKDDKYQNIEVAKKFIISFFGYDPEKIKKSNIEIEDFLNPEIIIYLVNEILKEKNLHTFRKSNIKKILDNIQQPAFQNNGILALLENHKNHLNPTNGIQIKIDSEGLKMGIANIFNNLDANIIKLIGNAEDEKNESIVEFLKSILHTQK